jgi:glutamyl-tRNA reductase
MKLLCKQLISPIRLKNLRIIAFTHKNLELKEIGKLVLAPEEKKRVLSALKEELNIQELFYIGTCNRVELVFTMETDVNDYLLKKVIQHLSNQKIENSEILRKSASIFQDEAALVHLMRVSSSLESLVVGEKEILAQVRSSYDEAKEWGFTGDFLRLCMNRVVKTAKEIYTNTKISEKPISVVSIAYRLLRNLDINENTRFLIIGAGETNQLFAKYLKKQKLNNFTVFNRTLSKAESLAAELEGKALGLESLKTFNQGFDVIITCTSATEPIITKELYQVLLNNEKSKKIILDLAIPNDTAAEVIENNPIHFINIESIQETIKRNMDERYGELCHAEQIIDTNVNEFRPLVRQRKIELAMQVVPQKIKDIRNTAINSVFANDINELDDQSREVLEKVLNYMEKKYISIPMLMAKDILIKE